MEIIGTILTGIFVALLLFVAVSFGFMLLVWFAIAGAVVLVLFLMRDMLRRWMFLYRGKMQEKQGAQSNNTPDVIEGDYKDISDDTK